MSINLGRMIDEVKGLLQSWSSDEEQSTTLKTTIGSGDVSLTVTQPRGTATGISPGIVEIETELLYCDTVSADGTVTVVPWGRGYLHTTPAVHLAGARVVSQPTFPRQKVIDAINQTLARVYPRVYAVKAFETVATQPVITYDVPDNCQRVLSAKWLRTGARQYWQDVEMVRQPQAGGGTHAGDTGVTVDIGDRMTPGQPLLITYAAKPGFLVNETDDFETVTGLDISIEDVVTTGAAVAMLAALEMSRLQTSSVEQQNRSALVAPSAALTSSRFLDQRFITRLGEERKALQELYPPRILRRWN